MLTCRATAKETTLHFVINKLVQQRDTVYERVQFQFEDDAYDSVADLITYYVGSGRAISAASGARIQTPCNRTYPLTFYMTKYGVPTSHCYGPTLPMDNGVAKNGNAIGLPPRLPAKYQKTSLAAAEDKFKSLKLHSSSLSLASVKSAKFNSLPRSSLDQPFSLIATDPLVAPSPPPKPRTMQRDNSIEARVYRYHTSGSDSGNGSGDSVHSSMAVEAAAAEVNPGRGVVIRNPKYLSHSASSVTLTNYSEFDHAPMEEYLESLCLQEITLHSRFDLDNYETLLLPVSENKPLDGNALYTFRMMMFENAATIIAHHLTRADLKVVLGMEFPGDATKPATVDEGNAAIAKLNSLEWMTLREGGQFRVDLIERMQCMKLLVAVTILTCASDDERAETLNKWIQVATEVKNAYGNLFGFGAIVLGVNMPQIQGLSATWHVLRQRFTDNAFLFEAKMRPMWKAMNEANYQPAPNTTIPYVMPYVLMRDRGAEEWLGIKSGGEEENEECSLWLACVQPWVTSSNDDGLGITMGHLEATRGYINNLATFKQNAHIFMKDSSIRHDELLEDAFR